jgi:AmiR/NasT family two-component response regulator
MSQLAVERAQGVLAQRETINIDEAFVWLRDRSHDTGHSLADVAQAILDEAQPRD